MENIILYLFSCLSCFIIITILCGFRQLENIWVEPISKDSELRNELRGWYHLKDRYVENEYGNRFYLDTYGAKWLGYDNKDGLLKEEI